MPRLTSDKEIYTMRHIKKQFAKPAAKASQKSVVSAALEPVPALEDSPHVEVAMEPHDATIVQLAAERLTSARLALQAREQEIENCKLHLQNRQNELNALVQQVRVKYEDNGKFVMSAIDLDKATVKRAPRESVI